MARIFVLAFVLGLGYFTLFQTPALADVRKYPGSGDYVVLLHGILSMGNAMVPAAEYLNKKGFYTLVIPYPSRKISIEDTTRQLLSPAIHQHCTDPSKRIHFVGHSMGGIVIRHYLANHRPSNLGRVVLIAAPNQGNELADIFRNNSLVGKVFGPALQELGTDPDSLPNQLGPVNYDLGIIMGKAPRIPWLSKAIPEDDDGVVSVTGGKIRGMNDFEVIKGMHTSLKRSRAVFYQTYYFLKVGSFNDHPPKREIRKPIRFQNLRFPAAMKQRGR